MSRSYKKTPINKENRRGSNRKIKKLANSRVRSKLKDDEYIIPNGKAYQKEYNRWYISEFKYRLTKEATIEDYKERFANPESFFYDKNYTLKHHILWWRKHYKNK